MSFRELLLAAAAGVMAVWLASTQFENHSLRAQLDAINQEVQQEQVRHAKKLSEATNTIVTASREYDAVRAERDVLSDRLRKQVGGRAAGNSAGTCEARAAKLARMVDELSGLVERCDNGWHGCAVRKDALSEVVK